MAKLLEVCKISGTSVKEFEGIIKYVATGDIINNCITNYTDVTFAEKPSRANVIAEEGTVLFAKMKDTIKVLCVDKNASENIYSTGFYNLKPNKELDINYLYWYLNSTFFNFQKDNLSVGATMKALNNNGLKSIEFGYLPDKEIQKERSESLRIIQNSIDNRKNFVNLSKKMIDSKLNEIIRETTEYEKLEKLCVLKARIGWQGLTKKEYQTTGNYKLITGIDFDNGKINFENCVYVSDERYDQDKNIQIRKNDILITKDGTIGKVAFIDEVKFPATLNSGVFTVRIIDKKIQEKYLYYILQSDYFQSFVEKIKTGATIPHLNQASFYNFKIPVLKPETQEKFIEFVEIIERQIKLATEDIENLSMLMNKKLDEYYHG